MTFRPLLARLIFVGRLNWKRRLRNECYNLILDELKTILHKGIQSDVSLCLSQAESFTDEESPMKAYTQWDIQRSGISLSRDAVNTFQARMNRNSRRGFNARQLPNCEAMLLFKRGFLASRCKCGDFGRLNYGASITGKAEIYDPTQAFFRDFDNGLNESCTCQMHYFRSPSNRFSPISHLRERYKHFSHPLAIMKTKLRYETHFESAVWVWNSTKFYQILYTIDNVCGRAENPSLASST